MKPYFRSEPELGAVFRDFGEGDYIGVNASLGFDHEFEITPRLWLGFKSACGLGIRGRYWQYDHSANGALDFSITEYDDGESESWSPKALDNLSILHELEMHTFDVEVTQDFNWCRSDITIGGGVRYARFQQDLNILYTLKSRRPRIQDGYLYANYGSGFEGAGPTFSLNLRRRIGQSNFYFTGGFRESVIFVATTKDLSVGGQRRQRNGGAPTNDQNGDNGDDEDSLLNDDELLRVTARNEEVRAITELQVGLQYERCLECCTLLLHGGYEGQIWHSTGQSLLNTSDLGMHGFSAGVTFVR
jgi:hypothetical protein